MGKSWAVLGAPGGRPLLCHSFSSYAITVFFASFAPISNDAIMVERPKSKYLVSKDIDKGDFCCPF